jgi:uroporphyrinogen-III synthase
MSADPRRRRVVVTADDGPGRTLAARLAAAGVDVRVMPVVTHTPPSDSGPLDHALSRLPAFDWVVFTSVRAVDAVCEHEAWRRFPWPGALRPRVAAVGPITRARLEERGVAVAVCPREPGGLPLVEAMITRDGNALAGRSVLWPCSNIARPELAEALRAAGAELVAPVAYCTESIRPPDLPQVLAELDAGRIDAVAFLSPSAVAGLAGALPGGSLAHLRTQTLLASVGPTTTAALADGGAMPEVEAVSRTAGGLATALLSYFGLSETSPS